MAAHGALNNGPLCCLDGLTEIAQWTDQLNSLAMVTCEQLHGEAPAVVAGHLADVLAREFQLDLCRARAAVQDGAGRYLFASEIWIQDLLNGNAEWHGKPDAALNGPVLGTRSNCVTRCRNRLTSSWRHWKIQQFPVPLGGRFAVGLLAIESPLRDAHPDELRFVLDENGELLSISPKLLHLLGYPDRDAGLTRPLLPNLGGEAETAVRHWVLQHGGECEFDSTWVSRSGRRMALREKMRLLRDIDGAARLVVHVEDCSARQDAEDRERDRIRLLEAMSRNHDLSAVLGDVVRSVVKPYQGWGAALLTVQDAGLVRVAAENLPVAVDGRLQRPLPMDVDDWPSAEAARLGRAIWSPDLELTGAGGCWSEPLLSGDGRLLGTLDVYPPKAVTLNEADTLAIRSASRLAAVAMEHRRLYDELLAQADRQAQTTLPARSALEQGLRAAVSGMGDGGRVALLWIDLDRFKDVFDTLGLAAARQLLTEVTARFEAVLEPGEQLIWLGGDEFALLMHQIRSRRQAACCAERLLKTLENSFQSCGCELFLTASVGISLCPDDAVDALSLQKNADAAMYKAKREGRNTYQFFDRQSNVDALQKMRLATALRYAVQRNELVLHYQPQVSMRGELRGFEALVRWKHPDLGLLNPGQFLAVAEEAGLLPEIEKWVIEEAFRQAAIWATSVPVAVAVNVSSAQLYAVDFLELLEDALQRHDVNPRLLEIELTESSVMKNLAEAATVLYYLRSLGLSVAIDDFGTGYSSLSYLQRLPVNTLKLDRSFLDGAEDGAARKVLAAIVTLAHGLDLTVLAEGIESPEQFRLMHQLGLDQVQGYLFGRPLPAEAATELLKVRTVPLPAIH